MTDEELITMLRGRSRFCRNRNEIKSPDLMDAAADRIEQLVNDNHRWKMECEEFWREREDAAEAKLAKAVEALRPFGKAGAAWEPENGDDDFGARIEHPHHGLERHAEFTFGDLRHARAILAELEKTE